MSEKKAETAPFEPEKGAPIDPKNLQVFWIELNILARGSAYPVGFPFRIEAHSKEEAAHYALFILATQWPNVTGYNVRSADQKTILETCNGGKLMALLMKPLQEMTGMQPFKTAVPVLETAAKGVDLKNLYDEARKSGRVITP